MVFIVIRVIHATGCKTPELNDSACFLSCHSRTAASPECLPHCWPFFSFSFFTIQVTFRLQTSKALRHSALSSLCIVIVKNDYHRQNYINWYSHNLKLKSNFAFIQAPWTQWHVGVFQRDSFEVTNLYLDWLPHLQENQRYWHECRAHSFHKSPVRTFSHRLICSIFMGHTI